MKYTCEVEINLPRKRVVELFQDPNHIKDWQEGFISMEHVTGEPGQAGAISNMHYKMGKREIDMQETITKNALPDEFVAHYHAKGVHNIVENFFVDLGGGKTRFVTHNIFNFKGFMKIIAFFMPGAFKKTSQKYLDAFKKFAESQG